MGFGEIWVCARNGEAGRHIKKVFNEANLFNPLRIIDSSFDFNAHFKSDDENPVLLLIDLDLPDERAWRIISAVHGTRFESRLRMIALVDNATERLIDRAYDSGVRSYLRKPFSFADFLGRVRLLNMQLIIARSGGTIR